MTTLTPRRRVAVLVTVCLAVLAINLDTTIVNVALPSLSRQLHASTSTMQWVVDGYALAFAALVLAGGSIGDRLGRRPMLLAGLAGFAAASVGAALSSSVGELIAWRFVMGAFAAAIYPTTLSIIANAYPDRAERAKAIGVWGAVTGLGVAAGPVTGGLLLAHFTWASVFWALVPVAAIAAGLTVWLVPESKAPAASRFDLPGLFASSAAIGILVYTVIEAPGRGWLSAASMAGYAATAVAAAVFVIVERRSPHPMIDVSLFKVPAFSAASASVTISFFALYGFIFLVTQYMQVLRGWGTLSTGLRILPVAAAIGVGSAFAPKLVARYGTRGIVITGLVLFAASLAWIALSPQSEPYAEIAVQMVMMGAGLGLTTTPATESILSVLPPAKAGVGSAVNDATREAGGTLGVAVIGSIFSSIYVHHLAGTAVAHLPAAAAQAARGSVAAAMTIAQHAPGGAAPILTHSVSTSFMTAFTAACLAAAAVCALGAVAAIRLPGRPGRPVPAPVERPSGQEGAATAAARPMATAAEA
jgi:EmrB/QacA subfamily drug resistance transporter